jgi:hypothetical protein
MIKSAQQIKLMRIGLPDTPCNFGSESSSSANQTTTNNVNNIDRRLVGSEEAMLNSGDGSSLTRITNTNFTDGSNRSTNFTDSSNRSTSTNFSDSSVRNTTTNTNITTTDFGSVGAALSGMGTTANLAIDNAGQQVQGAINLLRLASSNGLDMLGTVLDFAAGSAANSDNNIAKALGFAGNTINDAITKTSSAFAQASESQDNKSLKIAAIAIVAVAVAFALKK